MSQYTYPTPTPRHRHNTRLNPDPAVPPPALSIAKTDSDVPIRRAQSNRLIADDWATQPHPPHPWPPALTDWPRDITRAALFDFRELENYARLRRRRTNPIPVATTQNGMTHWRVCRNLLRCHGRGCATPVLATKARKQVNLCACTEPRWHGRLNKRWSNRNIELRHVSYAVGLGIFARKRFPAGDILGEYVGEMKPNTITQGEYLYSFTTNTPNNVVYAAPGVPAIPAHSRVYFEFDIDSENVGGWSRFCNHSCNPNAAFRIKRVGDRARIAVEVLRNIAVGDQITVDYGAAYWRGVRYACACGTPGCRWRQRSRTRR